MHPGRRQGRRPTTGAALIALLIAAALLIFFLDDIARAVERTYTVVGVFPEAHEVKKGTEVRVAGVAVGRVTGLDLLPPGEDSIAHVAATLELPTRVQPQVRRDSELRLYSPHLIDPPVIDIAPGTAATPALDPGDTLYARPRPRLEPLRATVSSLGRAVDSLMASAGALETQLQARAPALRRLDAELTAAQREFAALSRQLEATPLAGFLADPAWRRSLERIQTTAAEIGRTIRARATGFGDPALARAVERLGRRADLLGERTAELRKLLEEPRGFPARWEKDPALRNALEAVHAQLDSLAEETRREPWRYFF